MLVFLAIKEKTKVTPTIHQVAIIAIMVFNDGCGGGHDRGHDR